MLDALINRQDRDVACSRKAARFEDPLQATEHARRTIGRRQHAIDEVGTRQVEVVLRDRPALMREQRGIAAEQLLDSAQGSRRCNTTYCGHVPPHMGRLKAAPTKTYARTSDRITGNSKCSTTALAAAFSTISSIGSARSAASTCSIRPRVSGWRGVNSVQQS